MSWVAAGVACVALAVGLVLVAPSSAANADPATQESPGTTQTPWDRDRRSSRRTTATRRRWVPDRPAALTTNRRRPSGRAWSFRQRPWMPPNRKKTLWPPRQPPGPDDRPVGRPGADDRRPAFNADHRADQHRAGNHHARCERSRPAVRQRKRIQLHGADWPPASRHRPACGQCRVLDPVRKALIRGRLRAVSSSIRTRSVGSSSRRRPDSARPISGRNTSQESKARSMASTKLSPPRISSTSMNTFSRP
jgi:hypothetical protein